MLRKLDWKPVEDAPNMQRVLLWDSKGNFFSGRVSQDGRGGYECFDEQGYTAFNVTHYAVVEGPRPLNRLRYL